MARLIVSVDTDALKSNLEIAKQKAKGAKIIAMVKANAYGHGLSLAAKSFESADAFGVATIDEAITLRNQGILKPILLMQGILSLNALRQVIEHDITIVIHHSHQIDLLKNSKFSIKVWVKVNTGFNRLGFAPDILDKEILKLEKTKANILGIMTHYAKANEVDSDSICRQQEVFADAVKKYSYPLSLSNSAGLLNYLSSSESWVRPGLILYGVSPIDSISAKSQGLKPAMTLMAQLISSYYIKKGERVGYGAHFEAQKDMRIGIVSIGYGDGYHWMQDMRVPVLINGQKTNIIGQVSMDMIAIDLDNIKPLHIGDYVTIWGGNLPIEEVAQAMRTSPYALLCSAPTQKERAIRESNLSLVDRSRAPI